MLHKNGNLRKIQRFGGVHGPQPGLSKHSVREGGMRRAKPAARFGTLAAICFFNIYFALHYIRLALTNEYGPSLLDEITCVIVLPFAILFLKDRRSWLPALSMLGFCLVLMAGAFIFPNKGVPQPFSALLTIALDSKLAIMTFAFAWIFKRTGSTMQVFESLFILIIIICLINIPFILHDLGAGVSIKGSPLEKKGVFWLPHGLFLFHGEVAWLNTFGAFAAATRYRLRKRMLDLTLCVLFVVIACLVISVKEIVGCFAGLLIIFRARRSGYGSFGMQIAALAAVAVVVLNYTELGSAILGHVGMFYGSDAIDSVRAGMLTASFRIAADYFPLGGGGGTFGSAASYQYGYSQLYYDYGIYLLWGGSPDYAAFLQDAYWPKVIGEGGVLGFIFYVLFLMSCGVSIIYRDPNASFHQEALRRLCLALLSLILVVSIASSPFTDELLTFVTALCFGCGMSGSLRAGGGRNGALSPAIAR